MQHNAMQCSSIIPPHVHDQLGNLFRVDLSRFLPHNSHLALSFKESQAAVEHVLCSQRPAEHSDVPGDESTNVSMRFSVEEARGDLHCAGTEHSDTQVLVLDGVWLHADGRAGKRVRLGEVLGSGAEHGADLGSGRHFGGCGCCRDFLMYKVQLGREVADMVE
jgi:hypothetical protein